MSLKYSDILNVPERLILSQKITKAFFLRNFELNSSDKNLLNSEIVHMEWLVNITSHKSNIPTFRNDLYSYDAIQVISCTLKDSKLKQLGEKCATLIQKNIIDPVLLIIEDEDDFMINLCDKRLNQSDKSKRIIESHINSPIITKLYKNEHTASFFNALDFGILDKTNLETLYKSYINAVAEFQIAIVTGTYNKRSVARSEADLKHLATIEAIEKEIITLSNLIKKETQLNNKVSLNIEIQRRRNQIQNIKNLLSTL